MSKRKFPFLIHCLIAGSIVYCTSASAADRNLKVMITPELGSVKVRHNGKSVTIRRNQNFKNRIIDELALTSRECPPHCVQPIKLDGIETIGELELFDYLNTKNQGDQSILVVDTRAEKHVAQGTIPGTVNIPGSQLIEGEGANPISVEEILTKQFGVTGEEGAWNFGKAKTLVLYCYGIWCGQAPRTFAALVKLGYPKNKLKWYRGGMQAWESLGLTTIRTNKQSAIKNYLTNNN